MNHPNEGNDSPTSIILH